MNRKYFIGIVGAAILCFIIIFISMVHEETKSIPLPKDPVRAPASPFKTYIFGVGIVEPISGNISIGTSVNRIVDHVAVKVGMRVKKGDVLFRFENKDLEADLNIRELEYQIAIEKLKKLESLPRLIDVSPSEAVMKSALVEMDNAKNQYEMAQGLQEIGAISQEEFKRRYFNYQQSEARLQEAKANLEKTTAKTWQPDLDIARLEALQAKESVDRAKAELDRTIIKSPIDGNILQIKIHEGELPPPDTSRTPVMILGNVDQMRLRVSIDQFDAPYFDKEAPAVAFFQNDPNVKIPLEFVELEPYLVNKQNLTNEPTEQIDTRVLQVIYRVKSDTCLYIEQPMDVFIKTDYTPGKTHAS